MFQHIFNQTALIAPKRKNRPIIHKTDTNCPFCLENIDMIEEIVTEEWQDEKLIARIVTNKYPIISNVTQGLHDVIIDTESHLLHPKDFTFMHWEKLLLVIQHRWQYIIKHYPTIQMIQVFKNHGLCAGASISHSHWQLIALEDLPYSVYEKYTNFNRTSSCYFCEQSHYKEGYLIWETFTIEVWAPPIPQYMYEVWFIPKVHHQHYGELSQEELRDLGTYLKYLLEIYEQINPGYDFNICMMSGDVKGQFKYHFYIKLVMRVGHIAGFEISTGCHIVTTNPKDYAKQMKMLLKERIKQ